MLKKHKQLLLLILAFLVTGAFIGLLGNPVAIGALSGAFLIVVGAYTALDLRSIVKGTTTLPSGVYAVAENWKYFTAIGLILLLAGVCVLKQYYMQIKLDLAFSVLGSGAIGIMGFVITGMKLNKAATFKGPNEEL